MASVTFRAKVQVIGVLGSGTQLRRIKVPRLDVHHFDGKGTRYTPLSGNVQIFRAYLAREAARAGARVGSLLYLNSLPESVTVDDSGFLAVVTIKFPEVA